MTAGFARRLPLLGTLAASVACLAAAYVEIGLGPAACLAALPGALLLLPAKARGGWAAHVFLAAMVCAAAAAAVAGAPALLVVPGGALALAAWDLAEHERFLRDGDGAAGPGESPHTDRRPGRYDRVEEQEMKRHVVSLAKAFALGLLAAGGGLALSLRIPFALMLLLVLLDLGCLVYALRLLRR